MKRYETMSKDEIFKSLKELFNTKAYGSPVSVDRNFSEDCCPVVAVNDLVEWIKEMYKELPIRVASINTEKELLKAYDNFNTFCSCRPCDDCSLRVHGDRSGCFVNWLRKAEDK